MLREKTIAAWLVAGFSLLSALPIVAQEPADAKTPQEQHNASKPQPVNVALGKPYTLSPPPNYKLCTGTSDATDLTDGKRADGELWMSQATVGWVHPKGAVSITFDLREPCVINRLRYCTGAGRAGVTFPSQLDYEASLDGKSFHRLGDLTQDTPEQPPDMALGYRPFVYDVRYPPVKARYVRIHSMPRNTFFFSDEVEIYSDPEATPVELEKFPVVKGDDDFIRNQGSHVIRQSFRRLLAAATAGQGDSALESRIDSWQLSGKPEDLDGVYPFDPLQDDIFARNALRWRQSGVTDFVFWTGDFYEPVIPERLAPECQRDSSKVVLRETMMSGERRGLALNIASVLPEPLPLQVELHGFDGEALRVIYLDSKKGEPTSTLLAPMLDKNGQPDRRSRVIPGMTTQVVVIPKTHGLQPGVHHFHLTLILGTRRYQFPVELDILPLAFPERPALKTGGYDYLDAIANGKQRNWLRWPAQYATEAGARMREMLFQVRCASNGCFAASRPERLKYGDDGALLSKPDFTGFDNWVAAFPEAAVFHVFCGLGYVTALDNRLKPGTPQFDRAIAEWAGKWNRHILEKQLKGRVIFQLLDEPWDAYKYDQERCWNKPFRQGAPDIPTLTDPTLSFRPEWAECLSHSTIVCPNTALLQGDKSMRNLADFRRVLATNGGELWCYSCGFSTFTAPPAAMRNQGWIAARAGAVGSLFWGLTSTMPSIRNMYSAAWSARHFSPFWFMEDGRMGITKHCCAMRDGIQDYELLRLLRESLDKAAAQGRDVAQARADLANALNTVAEETFPLFDVLRASQGTKARQEILRLLRWANGLPTAN